MLTTTRAMGIRAMSAASCTGTRSIFHGVMGIRSVVPASSTKAAPLSVATGPRTRAGVSIRALATAAGETPTPVSSSPSASLSPPQDQPLDWTTFFALRKSRRYYQLTFSVIGALGFSMGGSFLLVSPLGDSMLSQLPLDPFVGFGLGVTMFLALGWLAGPSVGNACFYLRNSRWRTQMTRKEVEFFARVKKNRVDPSASSTGNPVPDFYGEKIQSVRGYRQWLKDQRAFNKKRITFV